jgi:hypothetical protein
MEIISCRIVETGLESKPNQQMLNKNQLFQKIVFTILFVGNLPVGFAQNPLFIPPILEGDEIDYRALLKTKISLFW